MARNSGTRDSNVEHRPETKGNLENEVDALYKLPLPDFTAARNTLAAGLKKSGRGHESDFVKTLGKPSISAWAVNQLYWKHRTAFDRLLATGKRFHQAQISRLSSKVADMREALDARRQAVSTLSDLATALLREAGHSPTFETLRRITTTLEAISASASLPDAPRPGRLTDDVDPPGFESLASWTSPAGTKERSNESRRDKSSPKSGDVVSSAKQKSQAAAEARQLEVTRQAKLAATKAALQEARKSLNEARARTKSLELTQRKAQAETKEAERQTREAEERFNKSRVVLEDAKQRNRSIKSELEEMVKEVKEAERTVERVAKDLELLFRESPGK